MKAMIPKVSMVSYSALQSAQGNNSGTPVIIIQCKQKQLQLPDI
jgi:hypothetical protein